MPSTDTAQKVNDLLPILKLCMEYYNDSDCKPEWIKGANDLIDIYQQEYHPEEMPRAIRNMEYLQEVYLFFKKD